MPSITKFGVQIPRNVKEAIALDERNGNTLWQDAMKLELGQLDEYQAFEAIGKGRHHCPHDFQLIHCHMVFDCKEDGRRKARFVAGGHLTEPPRESVYSSVASLRSIRMITFLAELNGLELMTADVGNAYLEAHTKEKVAFIAGPEFGPLEGHVLLIHKASMVFAAPVLGSMKSLLTHSVPLDLSPVSPTLMFG